MFYIKLFWINLLDKFRLLNFILYILSFRCRFTETFYLDFKLYILCFFYDFQSFTFTFCLLLRVISSAGHFALNVILTCHPSLERILNLLKAIVCRNSDIYVNKYHHYYYCHIIILCFLVLKQLTTESSLPATKSCESR